MPPQRRQESRTSSPRAPTCVFSMRAPDIPAWKRTSDHASSTPFARAFSERRWTSERVDDQAGLRDLTRHLADRVSRVPPLLPRGDRHLRSHFDGSQAPRCRQPRRKSRLDVCRRALLRRANVPPRRTWLAASATPAAAGSPTVTTAPRCCRSADRRVEPRNPTNITSDSTRSRAAPTSLATTHLRTAGDPSLAAVVFPEANDRPVEDRSVSMLTVRPITCRR